MADRELDPDLSLDEAVATVVAELPEPVQRFVTGPERDEVSLDLTNKYNLHADQAGDFEHAFIFMLLGLYSPEDFVKELRDAGLNESTIQGLATDVNERVFKRLRDEERRAGVAPARKPAVPVMEVGPRPPESPPAPAPVPPPQVQPVPAPQAPPVPQIAPPAAQASAAPAPIPIYSPPAPYPEHPHARTMAGDIALASQGLQGQAATSASSFQTASVPVTYAPPPPPPPLAPAPPPQYAPPTAAPIRLTPVDRRSDTPIKKEFGSDPYREPIE